MGRARGRTRGTKRATFLRWPRALQNVIPAKAGIQGFIATWL